MNNQLFPAVSTDVFLVSITDGEPRTTTLAIADGTENEHASIIALVRNYLSDLGEFGNIDFKSTLNPGQKRATEYASLNEGQSTFLLTLMRNSEIVVAFKKRLVKAFLYLKSQPASPAVDLNDPAFLRTALLTYTEKVLALESAVSVLQPKAEAHDLLTISEGSMCISNASKVLEFQKVKDCFAWLHGIHWIFRQGGEWRAHQDRVRLGLLEVKTFSYESSDGTSRTKDQTLITVKGLAKLSLLRKTSDTQLSLSARGVA